MHYLSVEARLKDYLRRKKRGIKRSWRDGCAFELSIGSIFYGRHDKSLQKIMDAVIEKNSSAGDPLIEAGIHFFLNPNTNKRYRTMKIGGKTLHYKADYTCEGHYIQNGKKIKIVRDCVGCRFYR